MVTGFRSIATLARAGAALGLAFAGLEVFAGGGFGEALPVPPHRMPDARLLLVIAAFDVALAVTLSLAMGLLLAGRASLPVALGSAAGLLAGVLALAAVMYRSHFGETAWEAWRGWLLLGSVLIGVVLAVFLGWLARVIGTGLARSSVGLIAVLVAGAYFPIWLLFVGVGAVREDHPLPWSTAVIVVAVLALLAGSARLRRPGAARAMRSTALVAGLLAVALPIAWSPAPPDLPRQAPSSGSDRRAPVILILIDTLRADHLGLYGYPRQTSPHLDSLADVATVFERCISPSPWTAPAHASLFTGLFPSSHGVRLMPEKRGGGMALRAELQTLAESFQGAGFRTAAAVSNDWLRAGSGFDQGFEAYYHAPRHRFLLAPLFWGLLHGLDGFPPLQPLVDRALARAAHYFVDHLTFSELAQASLDWIEQTDEEPFFLFLNAMEPHDEYLPPPPFRDRWPGRLPQRVPFHELSQAAMGGKLEIAPRLLDHLLSQYDGEIAYVDAQVGTFLKQLRILGLFERSWIVVTSDHGEHFGEHGLLWHRNSVHDALLHVPLIIKRPGQSRGDRIAAPVQLVDIMPMLLAEAGIPIPDGLAGTYPGDRRATFAELHYDAWMAAKHEGRYARELFAYDADGFKLVMGSDGTLALYDRTRDPEEKTNLAALDTEQVSRYREQLETLLASLPVAGHVAEEPAMDEDLQQRLRAMGYLE